MPKTVQEGHGPVWCPRSETTDIRRRICYRHARHNEPNGRLKEGHDAGNALQVVSIDSDTHQAIPVPLHPTPTPTMKVEGLHWPATWALTAKLRPESSDSPYKHVSSERRSSSFKKDGRTVYSLFPSCRDVDSHDYQHHSGRLVCNHVHVVELHSNRIASRFARGLHRGPIAALEGLILQHGAACNTGWRNKDDTLVKRRIASRRHDWCYKSRSGCRP